MYDSNTELRPVEDWVTDSPGKRLTGVIVEADEFEGANGPYPVLVVRPPDSESDQRFRVWHTVAQARLARLQPQVGDPIDVLYLGKAQGKRGTYHDYRVAGGSKSPTPVRWAKYNQRDDDDANGQQQTPPPSDRDVPPADEDVDAGQSDAPF